MRSAGVPERLITGDGSDYEKFLAWAGTMPWLIGNPLYHWSHLELRRYFGISQPLSPATAPAIWERANTMLTGADFTPRALIERSHVAAVCTTDDPADSLEYHARLRAENRLKAKVVPAMRPDRALHLDAPGFTDYLKMLGAAASMEIHSFSSLEEALEKRIEQFDRMGCCASDHGFSELPYAQATERDADSAFKKALSGDTVSRVERQQYQTALMRFLAGEYHKRGWVMEIHTGAQRNNNPRMFRLLGPDTGFDAVGDSGCAAALAGLLGELDLNGALPKTVLFNLNPKDNMVLSTIMGCFQSDEAQSKLQFGSAWWFLDHKPGMEAQLETLAATGVLAKFVGMVTDSRSFLSYPRHEYFRRILCNLIGTWVENGEYPNDPDALGEIVEGICFENARRYFNLFAKDGGKLAKL